VRLIVVATPIGNLSDITLRAIETLRAVDVIACEDTRHTRKLLDSHGVDTAVVSYHEHNERERARELVRRVQAGETVALVSDAGMPLVSDPGYVVVRACIDAGVRVEVLPGPSAVTTALAASGLPGDTWRFVGFLPRKASALTEALSGPETVVAFESPKRVRATLARLEPDRPVAVCRELTKLHEEVLRGTAGALAGVVEERGEIVLVIGGATADRDFDAALAATRRLVEAGAKPRPAAREVAGLTGVSANELYAHLTL
jgi:16S rRNA (cytidine1402-2'-O)-methyltransferase